MPLRLLLPLLLLTAPALAAKGDWRARVGVETGVDGNPARLYRSPTAPEPPGPDAMLSLLGALEGRLSTGSLLLSGGWDVGARGFPREVHESTLVQAARAEAALQLHPSLSLLARGRGKDRRGADREYTELVALAGIAWQPDARLSLELLAQGGGFQYREDPTLSFAALGGAVNARYRFDRRHSLSLLGEANDRHFSKALARERPTLPPGSRRRHDTSLLTGLSYSYRGAFALTAGYTYAGLTSNSFGETVLRHRVSASAGVPLFWDLTLLAQMGLQLASYPDGIYLSPELALLEDDENQNALALKLSRPLSQAVDVELRWALYQNRLAGNGLHYLRQVAGIGVTWRIH